MEVHGWRQVRSPAVAARCDHDVGVQWPCRHTLQFEGQVQVGTKRICPQDVKKMLAAHPIKAYWKECAAKHEQEELKDGVWFEPLQVLLRYWPV